MYYNSNLEEILAQTSTMHYPENYCHYYWNGIEDFSLKNAQITLKLQPQTPLQNSINT